MDKIFYKNTLIAILFKKLEKGTVSITSPDQPLQVVTHNRAKGEYTKAHNHTPKERIAKNLQECLIVLKGKIKVDLYSPSNSLFKSISVSPGEAILFVGGGHGVRILKDTQFFEVKNGPYLDDKILI